MAKKWIPKNMHEGAFTSFAKQQGMGVQECARAVVSGKVHASPHRRKQAQLALTFGEMARERKGNA